MQIALTFAYNFSSLFLNDRVCAVVPFEKISKLSIFMRSRGGYGCYDMILGPIGLLVRLSFTNVSMTQPSRSNMSLKLVM